MSERVQVIPVPAHETGPVPWQGCEAYLIYCDGSMSRCFKPKGHFDRHQVIAAFGLPGIQFSESFARS